MDMGQEQLTEIIRSLGRLEGKVDSALTSQQDHTKTIGCHDLRLRKIENKQSWIIGLATGAGALVSLAINWLKG